MGSRPTLNQLWMSSTDACKSVKTLMRALAPLRDTCVMKIFYLKSEVKQPSSHKRQTQCFLLIVSQRTFFRRDKSTGQWMLTNIIFVSDIGTLKC